MKSQRLTKVIKIYLLGTLSIWTKFHGNQYNSCQDISLKTKKVKLLVVLTEKSKDHKSQQANPKHTFHAYLSNRYCVWTKAVD